MYFAGRTASEERRRSAAPGVLRSGLVIRSCSASDEHVVEHAAREDEKQAVSNDVPGSCGVSRGAGGKTSAMNVETSGKVEHQGREEAQDKKTGQEHRTVKPESEEEQAAQQKLQPGHDDGGEVYGRTGQNLVVKDDLRECGGILYLVHAGDYEDPSQNQAQPEKERLIQQCTPAVLCRHRTACCGFLKVLRLCFSHLAGFEPPCFAPCTIHSTLSPECITSCPNGSGQVPWYGRS